MTGLEKEIYEHGTDTGANSRKQQECCSVWVLGGKIFVNTCSKTNDTGLYYELLSLGKKISESCFVHIFLVLKSDYIG